MRFGKILILSKSEAQKFTFDKPWICISIDSHTDWPKINKTQQLDCLQLSFADVYTNTQQDPQDPDDENRTVFNELHAKQILDFVKKLKYFQ
jgi:predicted protein tyrosine phosphatase